MHSDSQDRVSTQPPIKDDLHAGGRIESVPNRYLIAVLAVPTLLGLAAAKTAYRAIQSMGSSSEEIFRGARLPVLSFPEGDSYTQNKQQPL